MDKILNNLGLCMRARGVVTGAEFVVEGLQSKKVHYIFLASDAAKNTRKEIINKSEFYNVEYTDKYSSDELNQAIGKTGRMVIGITDKRFLKILK